ncbi:MAG TPA: penicillin-binding protein 1B [Burkholderiales bacterium]|nr:penicillin-binding protein 1B [Burkholderiales bacterium]
MARRTKLRKFLRFALLATLLAAAGVTLYLDFRVRHEFEGRRFALPARIFARPLELHVGLRIPLPDVVDELKQLGYRDVARPGESGWYLRDEGRLEIALRPFVFWDGAQPPRAVSVGFEGGKVSMLKDANGQDVPLARVEPLPIGGIYPAGNEDRILVRVKDVPQHLVDELIAVEDRSFHTHHGFDPRGLARAARSVFSSRVQGGSTITQQLVKNFFLTPERTIQRKATELVMAVLLEMHYEKDEILETYLNEIYFGQDRDRAIHGVGLAAQYYFAKDVQYLSVAESAMLVGMIRGPAFYDPYKHAARTLERRNLVLRETRDQGKISLEQYTTARSAPLGVTGKSGMGTSPYPAFLKLVHKQLRRDYDEKDLRSEGLRIFTTLDPRAQGAAESALTRRLAQFDKEKRFGQPGLEGAVVITDPQSGEVQAMVGGRDVRYAGYNRALDAARPVGSLLKPAIYLTALSEPSRYTLLTPIDDGPFLWKSRGAPDWEPLNYDKKFHGMVPLRLALAHSYNAAAARLGTDLGIDKVLGNLRRLGVEREVRPYASAMLGAVDLSPFEVAQMYQTIASGGFRSPLRSIREVTTQDGKPLQRYPLAVEQAFPPEPVYLLAAAMQDVVREGTGQAMKSYLPPEIAVAGKTGTTDEQRDAWFAGFSGDRLAVVWVGYDDNRAARLSGSAAALPIWGDLMAALRPEPLALARPERIEMVSIDPQSGLRGGASCPGALELPFVQGSAPRERAPCSGPLDAAVEAAGQVGQAVGETAKRAKTFLERLFGR